MLSATRWTCVLSLCLPALCLLPVAGAEAQEVSTASDDWQFAVSPFLWGVGLDGTLTVAEQERELEASAQQLLESLDFGVMVNAEARRNRWVLSFDIIYTALSKDVTLGAARETPVSAALDLDMTIIEGDVGYQVHPHADVFAGLRGVNVPVSLADAAGLLGDREGGFVDPILGARFRRYLSEKLWINLRGDIGGFGVGSDFSWFAGAALG